MKKILIILPTIFILCGCVKKTKLICKQEQENSDTRFEYSLNCNDDNIQKVEAIISTSLDTTYLIPSFLNECITDIENNQKTCKGKLNSEDLEYKTCSEFKKNWESAGADCSITKQ